MQLEMTMANQVSMLLAALVMIWAALSDAARYRIPNVACLTILLLYPIFALTSPTPPAWLGNACVFALVLSCGYILYLKKWAGAGDIKLIAVISLWAGPTFAMPFLLITALSGGVLSLGIGGMTLFRQRLSGRIDQSELNRTPIPYGVAIALGGLCTLALLSNPDAFVGG